MALTRSSGNPVYTSWTIARLHYLFPQPVDARLGRRDGISADFCNRCFHASYLAGSLRKLRERHPMKNINGDWIADRLAELVVVGYAVFFLWSVARSSGWF